MNASFEADQGLLVKEANRILGGQRMEKIFCVVSHTHWDREWYAPLEKLRIMLVDLMDHLLEILDEYPEYIFHLDAQTIVLEDYLEIRPYRKEALEGYIKQGRLLVGPWYVQNDFYLTSGESTIRNLLIGSRIAEKMGQCTWVGYTPDQFGLISQLPQIFNGFGMDSCIFGRGHTFFERENDELKHIPTPAEFYWESEDGSKVLAILMPFWYNNAQRFSEDIDKSMKLLEMLERNFEGVALTPYHLLMNGVDHLEAQENLLPILKELGRRLPAGKAISQISMQEYMEKVKKYILDHDMQKSLELHKGEMREGSNYHILQGTLSSRPYLKTMNSKAQNLLENTLEPLYSFIHMAGAANQYPTDFMNYLWKLLIQNHPHDSICGCSRDEVHDHMEDRYRRIEEVGEELLQRGMKFITAHVDRDGLTDGDYLITVFNTLEMERTAVVELELQFPVEEAVMAFKILDAKKKEVPFVLLARERKHRNMFSPINLPGFIEVDSFKIQLGIDCIAGLGYKALVVRPSDQMDSIGVMEPEGITRSGRLENEYLTVEIRESGEIDFHCMETGRVYGNILKLEDSEDSGDSYVYSHAVTGKTLTSEGVLPEIACICKNPFKTQYSLVFKLQLPECFDRNSGERSDKTITNRIELLLTLEKGSRWLEAEFMIDNASRDHRLRVLANSEIDCEYTSAAIPFDVITRDRREVLKGIKNGTQPNNGFVDLSDGTEGLAVLNEGMYEYEHLLDSHGTLAVTLLRANGKIENHSMGDVFTVPGNQCLRRITHRMALYPHKGNWADAAAVHRMKEFQNPILVCFQPVDGRKFMGGRPAVQDSEIREIFYRPDAYEHVTLPCEKSFFHIQGKDVVLSACKKSEKDESLVIRLYNCSSEESEFGVCFDKPVRSLSKLNLKEEVVGSLNLGENRIDGVKIKPKEIYTISVYFV
jgi:alpha-mannosidase